jgi:glycosyltransferase involved in cell wall biosynthesis
MKTILIVSLHNTNWGAERSTCSIAAYLKSLGYRVIIIFPKEGKILDIINEFELEYKIHYFRGWINSKATNYPRAIVSTLINLFQGFSLDLKLKKNNIKPDLIYSNTLVHGFGILLAKKYRVPHLQHIRENIDVFEMKFNWGYKTSLNFINNNSKNIICTCAAIKNRYLDHLSDKKTVVVYNGIPIKPYVKPVNNSNIFSMVYAGRLYKDKRPQDILKMICELVRSGIKDIRLDIYGEGVMEDELKAYVFEHKLDEYIKFKGFQKEIYYSNYLVGFLPSEFEAFARSTLEYMMAGLAVIGTNSGGTKEQVMHGETGYLYTPGNIQEMKDWVLHLYKNRDICLLYGANGYNRIVNLFSQDRYVENLSKYFIQAL